MNFGENVSKKLYDNDRKYLGSFTSSVIVSIAVNSSPLTSGRKVAHLLTSKSVVKKILVHFIFPEINRILNL